jgi:hypothetical protein
MAAHRQTGSGEGGLAGSERGSCKLYHAILERDRPATVPIVDVTVAVNFTAERKIEGSFDELTDVVVSPLIVKAADLVTAALPALSVLWSNAVTSESCNTAAVAGDCAAIAEFLQISAAEASIVHRFFGVFTAAGVR